MAPAHPVPALSVHPAAALTAFLDLDQLLTRVAGYAFEAAHSSRVDVLLHDPDAREFVVGASLVSGKATSRGERFPDRDGVAGIVLRKGQACIVAEPDLRAHGKGGHFRCGTEGPRSVMSAPLTVAERTFGVVEAMDRDDGRPFDAADLEQFAACCSLIAVALENASLYRRMRVEAESLKRFQDDHVGPFVVASPAMRRVLAQAERAARSRSTVLLLGETGTGKEQLARRIHNASPRAQHAFVALNCGALPESLVESELFGHEKGAFTGADRRHIGRFELAEGGTIFLDEVGDLPAGSQIKLLRVLQEHEITPVGGSHPIRVDVRVIAATHRDLRAEVDAGRFREDLFFRLHVVPIRLPPLRERPEDLRPLTSLFLERFAGELGRAPRSVTPEGLTRLQAHRWPGNVRELENLIERVMVLGDDGPIDEEELAILLGAPSPVLAVPVSTDGASFWEHERGVLVQALERVGYNQTHAAQTLRISREQLRLRMKRYGLLPRPDGVPDRSEKRSM